ncbi:MAG: aminoglycoside phosphotransferase family protein [Clostridium sp.]|nr:aminoglycoside phosphotransferase family protein [Clostridium sp.]
MKNTIDFNILKNAYLFSKVEPLEKGWSNDKKYIIYTKDNRKLLLRISEISKFDEKLKESEVIRKISRVCDNTPKFIDLKISENKILQLYTFIEGEEALECISKYSKEEQYKLGIYAGKTLKKIHESDKITDSKRIISVQKERIIERTKAYENSRYFSYEDQEIIKYIKENIQILDSSKIALCHGDYHLGNMIINNKKIYIIDFNRFNYEDIYKDFIPMCVFTREESIEFAKGQLKGYFEDYIPTDFWQRLKLFLAYLSLYSILWAESFSSQEVEAMIKRKKMVYNDFTKSSLDSPCWAND